MALANPNCDVMPEMITGGVPDVGRIGLRCGALSFGIRSDQLAVAAYRWAEGCESEQIHVIHGEGHEVREYTSNV